MESSKSNLKRDIYSNKDPHQRRETLSGKHPYTHDREPYKGEKTKPEAGEGEK